MLNWIQKSKTRPFLAMAAALLLGLGISHYASSLQTASPTLHGDQAHPARTQGWVDTHLYFGLGPADAPPLWEKHHKGEVVGVSDDPPGETYWKVANGIRLTGMPAYDKVLTETEMWQVSLLLANADKPLPPAALVMLHGAPPAPSPASPETKK